MTNLASCYSRVARLERHLKLKQKIIMALNAESIRIEGIKISDGNWQATAEKFVCCITGARTKEQAFIAAAEQVYHKFSRKKQQNHPQFLKWIETIESFYEVPK